MNDDEAIRAFGLPAAPDHRGAILTALEAEVSKKDTVRDDDLVRCLSVQLFSIGNVEDSLLIWQAKSRSFDLFCGLDVQFLCGAGIEATRSFLKTADSDESQRALEYLDECVEAGDFADWTAEAWTGYYRFYYQLDPEPPPGM